MVDSSVFHAYCYRDLGSPGKRATAGCAVDFRHSPQVGGLVEGWPLFNGGETLPITLSVGSNPALSRKTGLYCVLLRRVFRLTVPKPSTCWPGSLTFLVSAYIFRPGFWTRPERIGGGVNRDTAYLVSASRYGCCEVEGIGFSELGIVTARRPLSLPGAPIPPRWADNKLVGIQGTRQTLLCGLMRVRLPPRFTGLLTRHMGRF